MIDSRLIFILVVGGIIGGSVFFLIFISGDAQGDLQFSVPPPPFALTENPDVDCRYRGTLYLIDSEGKTIRVSQGSSQFGNPTFSVADTVSGKGVAGLVFFPKGGCDAPAEMEIGKTTLDVFWSFESNESPKTGGLIPKKVTTSKVVFPADSKGVKSLGYSSVHVSNFEDFIQEGQTFNVEVSVSGVLPVYYTENVCNGCSGIKYFYQINRDKSEITLNGLRVVSPEAQENVETGDSDSDGIINKFDDCKTQKETYNGYKDGDGCPDTLPKESETDDDTGDDTPPDDSKDNEGGDTTPEIDTDGECKARFGLQYIWDDVNNTCIPEDIGETGGTGNEIANVNAVFNVQLNYADGGKQQIIVPEDRSTFGVGLTPATLLGDLGTSKEKRVGSVEITTYLDFEEASLANKYALEESNIFYKPTVRVAGQDLNFQERKQVGAFKTAGQKLFGTPSGGEINGISLGTITITANEFHGVITDDIISEGQQRTLDFRVDVEGDIKLRVVQTGVAGFVTGDVDAFVSLGTLELTRAKQPTTGGGASGTLNCPDGFYLGTVGTVETCIRLGTTPNDDSTSVQCLIGEGGCDICTSSDNPNGFPCTEDYRDVFCSGITKCGEPPKSGNDNTFDPTFTGGVDDECFDNNLVSFEITSSDCLTSKPNDEKGDSGGGFCPTGVDCDNPFGRLGQPDDPVTIMIIVAVIAVTVGYGYAKTKNQTVSV